MKLAHKALVVGALLLPMSSFAAFESNLYMGSRGAEVTSLQETLVEGRYLIMPGGVDYGYYGDLTKAAVVRWQRDRGIAPTGFFGPISRSYINASLATSTTGGIVAAMSAMATSTATSMLDIGGIFPEVEIISSSISPDRDQEGGASSATARMRIKVSAIGGTLYLNGNGEVDENKKFLSISTYGTGITASTTAAIGGYSITSGSSYTVTNAGGDDEYFTLNIGNEAVFDIEMTLSQGLGTEEEVLAGLRVDAMRFGVDSTSDVTRSAMSLDLTDLGERVESGTVGLSNTSDALLR